MTNSQHILCDDCKPQLADFALDALTDELRDQVAEHLANGCVACNSELAEIVSELAALAGTLPQKTPPPHIEHRLIERAIRHGESAAARPRKVASRTLTRSLVASAAVLAALLIAFAAWTIWRQTDANRTLAEQVADLQRRLDETDQAQHFSPVPQLRFVSRGAAATAPTVHGYIVTDQVTRQWHVYVFNLPSLSDDRVYQFWFVMANGDLTPVGTVEADSSGTVSQLIDLPAETEMIAGLAVSDEPATGSNTPTGQHQFQANLPRGPSDEGN